jgi:uncharacterized protein (TIGR02466 family)
MIHEIFPTAIYTDQNVDLLSTAHKLFDLSKDSFFTSQHGVKTTLKEYSPLKAVTPFDPLKLIEVTPLKIYFRNSVEKYLNDTGYDKYDVEITNIWLNEMESGTAQTAHSHYGYTFSGIYYVDLPKDSEKIVFHSFQEHDCKPTLNHIRDYNAYNSTNWAMKLFPGTLVIFPAHLRHSVPVMQFEGIRRSIAFDAVCKPVYLETVNV